MIKHVGFTHNTFQLGQDGQTAYSGVRSISQPSLHLERRCCVSTITLKIRRSQSDLNLSGHMGSGLVGDTSDGSHLTLTSEGLMISRSVRRLTMSQRFNVAILRSAFGTPPDPSSRLQEFEEEFMSATTHGQISG
eukprot:5315328-Amphidinium_carterae.2